MATETAKPLRDGPAYVSMYSDFYQIPEQPFGTSPSPSYLYNSPAHSRSLTGLLENLTSQKCVQTLTAAPGCGKTTILYALLDRIGSRFRPVFVSYTLSNTAGILGMINRELRIEDPAPDVVRRRISLRRFFSERKRAAPRVLVLIDEAHNLSASTLEELGSALVEAHGSPRLILSGHSGSNDLLETVRRTTLHSEVSASHQLMPLDAAHTAHYVRHRMRMSGYTGPELFTDAALERIATVTKGIPRNINTLCFHALNHGTVARKREIDAEVIEEVLPRCAFLGWRRPMARETTQGGQSGKWAEMLRAWLSVHWGTWSGTAGELYQQLRSENPKAADLLPTPSAAGLLENIGWHSAALRRLGVDVEVYSRPGRPPRLTLSLKDAESGEAA